MNETRSLSFGCLVTLLVVASLGGAFISWALFHLRLVVV
jgi:hypothetical protein